jgi:hypothetical protein
MLTLGLDLRSVNTACQLVGYSIGFPIMTAWVEVLGRGQPPGQRHRGYARSRFDGGTGEIHAEAPLATPPWFAYARFRVVDGQLQLAEIRVFPGFDRIGLTKGSRKWPPIGAVTGWVPADDLVTPVLRGLPMRTLRIVALESLERFSSDAKGDLASPIKRPGRAGRSDLFYAEWASRYAERAGVRAPIVELAREYGLRREQVRDVIHQARERGLLGSGRSGLLTDKAKSILKEQ